MSGLVTYARPVGPRVGSAGNLQIIVLRTCVPCLACKGLVFEGEVLRKRACRLSVTSCLHRPEAIKGSGVDEEEVSMDVIELHDELLLRGQGSMGQRDPVGRGGGGAAFPVRRTGVQ